MTIHGAKGLESKIVFVMDTKPEAASTRTTTLLIEWPAELPAPTCCAFLYSESRCPASLQTQLEVEFAAREREELNALYVAMTRAIERLVVSATVPVRAEARPSWWDRLLPHAQTWSPGAEVARQRASAAGVLKLLTLPRLSAREASDLATKPARADPGEPARRLGQAVHRLLEWTADQPVSERRQAWSAMCADVAREFQVDASAAAKSALNILESPECGTFFARSHLAWSGNEVTVSDGADVLRIDRLVRLRDAEAPTWWVLDYKLSHAPEQLAGYREQLRRYRDVVARLEAPARVRCAFITGAGRLLELD
jgi:ATP-dependent helicase/nuclease subunit A